MNKICTSIEQSKKLMELGIDVNTADMCYRIVVYNPNDTHVYQPYCFVGTLESDIPAWSLSALLKLIPKHILRKDKIHYGQTFIPSFKWEITPTAIYYTDGNNIMNYVFFRYGENDMELIDAVFKMVCWLKKEEYI